MRRVGWGVKAGTAEALGRNGGDVADMATTFAGYCDRPGKVSVRVGWCSPEHDG